MSEADQISIKPKLSQNHESKNDNIICNASYDAMAFHQTPIVSIDTDSCDNMCKLHLTPPSCVSKPIYVLMSPYIGFYIYMCSCVCMFYFFFFGSSSACNSEHQIFVQEKVKSI